ncbi:MAG: hypothetical protein OER85_13440 [Gammaproteobacteria bacterium]|nr:hypothetical protein [Gammaproteobacteria bacterium]
MTNLLASRIGTTGAFVCNTATVVYTEGSGQREVAVDMPIAPRNVFNSMSRIDDQLADIQVVYRDVDEYSSKNIA